MGWRTSRGRGDKNIQKPSITREGWERCRSGSVDNGKPPPPPPPPLLPLRQNRSLGHKKKLHPYRWDDVTNAVIHYQLVPENSIIMTNRQEWSAFALLRWLRVISSKRRCHITRGTSVKEHLTLQGYRAQRKTNINQEHQYQNSRRQSRSISLLGFQQTKNITLDLSFCPLFLALSFWSVPPTTLPSSTKPPLQSLDTTSKL